MSLRVESFVVGPFPNNLYLLIDDEAGEAVVIDPSVESEAARARMRQLQAEGVRLVAVWNTHGHIDHVHDNALWHDEFGAPLWMHRADNFWLERLREQSLWLGLAPPRPVFPDHDLAAAQTLRVGKHRARVLHTPGHSPGSVSFVFEAEDEGEGLCFGGDVLFKGAVGRTDLPGCSPQELRDSLRTLSRLPATTRLMPGHGEATTIGFELATNPFCRFLADDASL